MQFSEMSEHVLRADLDAARSSGMEPRRAARHHLQRLRGGAGGSQHRQRVGFGVEHIDFAVGGGPMASDAGRFGASAAKAASGGELILRAIAAENLSDLEQRYVGKAAVRILLCSSNKPRDQARSHIRKIRSDWIGEREFGLSAAAQLRLLLR